MSWRRRNRQDYTERPRRPKVRRLSVEERDDSLRRMKHGIERSPVLSALGVEVLAKRGRFYVERSYSTDDCVMGTEALGRISRVVNLFIRPTSSGCERTFDRSRFGPSSELQN